MDKRTSHLSSMIVSEQMTREEALKELQEPVYDEVIEECIAIIKNRLEISDAEFEEIMKTPPHEHEEYKTDRFGKVVRKIVS